MTYKCILIDNDPRSIAILEDYIKGMPQLELLCTYADPILAYPSISSGPKVDFIFMNNDPKLNGIELSKMIQDKTTYLLFTTEYAGNIPEFYNMNGSFYLLRVVSFSKFASLITKVSTKKVETPVPEASRQVNSFFFIKNTTGKLWVTKIMTDDILYIEAKREQLVIHSKTEKVTTVLTLKEAEKLLLGTGEFIKIHRSYIIAVNHIVSMDPNEVKMSNKAILPLGKSYKNQLFEYVNKNLFRWAVK